MRIKEYIGPKIQIHPDELPKYEQQGIWFAEEKRDGAWAYLKTDEAGTITKIVGRSGSHFSNDSISGIKGCNIALPNSIIIGELETASQAATKLYATHGIRRMHVFDFFALKGANTTILTYDLRRKLVVAVQKEIFSKDPKLAKRFLAVRQCTEGFVDFYKDIKANDGEGIVLKRVDSKYKSINSSGKTEDWVRVKEDQFIDVYVMGHKFSTKGLDQLDVGIWSEGNIKRIQTILCPKGHNPEDLIGKVVEVKGAEMMESGAIRHGRFERIRTDKTKEMCII